jgi:hypothetical protein
VFTMIIHAKFLHSFKNLKSSSKRHQIIVLHSIIFRRFEPYIVYKTIIILQKYKHYAHSCTHSTSNYNFIKEDKSMLPIRPNIWPNNECKTGVIEAENWPDFHKPIYIAYKLPNTIPIFRNPEPKSCLIYMTKLT